MTGLPVGTVTFLFTDIQGSTELLEELGERYGRVQDEHASILTQAIEDADGVVVRTQGDGYFVAFEDPVNAVRAAVAAQRV